MKLALEKLKVHDCLQDAGEPGWLNQLDLEFTFAQESRYMLWQTLDAFVWICAAYLKAPVLSVESETCLGLSEKEGGLKKGEISKGEKWLSPCMYVLHCCHSYLLMASRHRTCAGYLARFVSSTSSDASATPWLICTVIDNIFSWRETFARIKTQNFYEIFSQEIF